MFVTSLNQAKIWHNGGANSELSVLSHCQKIGQIVANVCPNVESDKVVECSDTFPVFQKVVVGKLLCDASASVFVRELS